MSRVGESPLFYWLAVRARTMADQNRESIIQKVQEIAERVGMSEGIEIVEVQLLGGGRSRVLRLFIDKPEGVTHADCEFMSQQVGTILDVEDVIPGHYTLEVSSPGVERKLLKPRDFERFQGKKAKIVLREPVANQRTWEGTLAGLEEGVLALDLGAGKTVQFPLDRVETAHLKFEW
jgi:ribosome maturation factor RimP